LAVSELHTSDLHNLKNAAYLELHSLIKMPINYNAD